MPQPDTSLLTAALAGYQQQLAEINAKIAQIKKALGEHIAQDHRAGREIASPRHRMSTAARRRIAAAQRKRWAAYRKGKQ